MLSSPYPVPPSPLWTVARAAAYMLLAAAGAVVIINPPTSYSHTGALLTFVWGGACALSGVAMAAGVLLRRYRWEWLPGWIAAMGLSVYSVLSWEAVARDGLGHAPRALIITALVGLILSRCIQLSLIDMSARRVVEMREAVRDDE